MSESRQYRLTAYERHMIALALMTRIELLTGAAVADDEMRAEMTTLSDRELSREIRTSRDLLERVCR